MTFVQPANTGINTNSVAINQPRYSLLFDEFYHDQNEGMAKALLGMGQSPKVV